MRFHSIEDLDELLSCVVGVDMRGYAHAFLGCSESQERRQLSV